MKFTFAEKKMDSSEDLRAYAVKKIGKLDRFFRNEAEAFVTFSIERGRFRAADSGVAAIERQIRRNKTRLEKRLREGALERDAVPAFVPAEEDDREEFQIVRSKRFSIKPMSVQEAILQMNLLGHEFFVFRNMDAEDAISVVYERKNGGYGLICDDGLDE